MRWTKVASWGSILLLLLVILWTGRTDRRQATLAQQGAESHQALCVFQADLQRRANESKDFLAMSVAERVAKYGEALGTIDSTVIRNSLNNEVQTLNALRVLDCS